MLSSLVVFIFLVFRYLRQVDRFNDFSVSAYVTAGHVKLLLLHRTPSTPGTATRALEDAIREFFSEVHELYIKVSSPFCTYQCSQKHAN